MSKIFVVGISGVNRKKFEMGLRRGYYMLLGKVTGNIISTIKVPDLSNYKLLVVELMNLGKEDSKHIAQGGLLAIDLVGAGTNDVVMVSCGSQVQNVLSKKIPIDAAIIGIVDKLNYKI